jgi:metalloendopeptidase OMA1, mitochondrial
MNYLINQAIQNSHRTVTKVIPRGCSIFILTALLCACASVPHTGRRQLNMVSDKQLTSLGNQAFNELCATEPECKDVRTKDLVKRVVDRVAKAAEFMDHPGFKWEVRVLEKDVPNAFCLPGGKIVIFTGILPYARNEAGLAAVVAHEVAHVVARHGAERLSQQLALKGAVNIGGQLLKKEDGSMDSGSRVILGALGMGGTVGIILPYSRIHELEADQIGQLYMAQAGYDPSEGINLWERMAKIQKPPIPPWLSTHPPEAERISKLKEYLPQAQKIYAGSPFKYGIGMPI